MFTNLVCKLLL